MTAALAAPAPRRDRSLAFPRVLIGIGVLLLLANLGYVGGVAWGQLARLWPVLLVLAGIDLLVLPRSFALAAVVETAIVAGALVYLLATPTPASCASP